MQQPFFKPLTSTCSASEPPGRVFSYEGQRSGTNTPTTSNRLTGSYFAHPQSQKTALENETTSPQRTTQEQSAERLTSLHARLHQEAEKIRKWKIQTEIDIKQKDKKIQEASHTIESLRKSILELQLQNENLSLKLQEEMDNQEEILQKINATRDMCNLLKDYTAKVEDRLQKCETERTELKYMEKEHVKQYEELSEKFRQLAIATQETHNNLRNQLNNEQEQKARKVLQYQQQLSSAEQEIETLEKQCGEKEEHVKLITEELEKNNDTLCMLQREHCALKERFSATESVGAEQKVQLEMTCLELKETKEQKKKIELSLEDCLNKLQEATECKEKLASNFDATEKLYVEKIACLQREMCMSQKELEEHKNRLTELQTDLVKAHQNIENLKSSKDLLILEKTEATENFRRLDMEKDDLQKRITEIDEKLIAVTTHNACQSEQIKEFKAKEKKVHNEIEILNEELQAALQKEDMLKDELITLKEQLEEESSGSRAVSQKMTDLKSEKQSLVKELNSNKKEITKLKKDIVKASLQEESLKNELEAISEENNKLMQNVEQTETKFEEQSAKMQKLLQEKKTETKQLQDELKEKEEQISSLKGQMKSLKEENVNKNKKIKDIEKEVKNVKGKLASQSKLATALQDDSKDMKLDLNSLAEEKSEIEGELVAKTEELETKIVEIQELKNEKKEMERTIAETCKEKDAALTHYNLQIKEMAATLGKYKDENEKIVAKKEQEVSCFREKLQKLEDDCKTKQSKENIELSALNKELNQTKEKLEEVSKAKEDLELTAQEHEQKIQDLEENVKTKESELKELLQAIQKLKKPATPVIPKASNSSVKQNTRLTPKLPQEIPVPATPLRPSKDMQRNQIMATPIQRAAAIPKQTPQQSILKQAHLESVSKKRRVMFASECEDDGSGSESSSSELMEVEIDEFEKGLHSSKGTPLLVKPSPRVTVRPSPKGLTAESPRIYKGSKGSTPKPVPRGPPMAKQIPRTPHPTPNIRKAPAKAPARFFKSLPSEKKKKLSKNQKGKTREELAWFDSDSVFGFGVED